MFEFLFSRLQREKITIEKMIKLYCKLNHNTKGNLCQECTNLLDYAFKRIDNCPYSVDKPVCNKCPIHCYKKDMRERIRLVMRFSGPRMLRYHPILAILHILDKFKEAPEIKPKKTISTTKT
ncbi:MAG: nitrous oxide-stimulated promoter family protein [Candidatus Kapaibacteriota bacterium]